MKNIRKLLLVMAAFVFVLTGMVSVTEAAELREPNNDPAVGAGSEEGGSEDNPWIIESWEDLVKRVGESEGFFQLSCDINGGEDSVLEITAGKSITIDLNGKTLAGNYINVGEYDEAGAKNAAVSIVSSEDGGAIKAGSISVYGDLSFENCSAVITSTISGEGQFALAGASVTCEGIESDGLLGWYGGNIILAGGSTLNISDMYLYIMNDVGIEIGYGCAITNISYIEIDTEKPEEYISIVEKYATAAGFGLKYDKDDNGYYFTEDGKVLQRGELDSDEADPDQMKDLTEDMVVEISPVTYNGEEQTPKVTVIDGETVLTPETDYTVSYSNNMDVTCDKDGKVIAGAKVTITGMGNYSGTVEKTFTINPKDVIITAKSKRFIYDGTEHSDADYIVEGLVNDDKIEAVVKGSIKFPSESRVANEVYSYQFMKGKSENYNVTTKNGILTVIKAKVIVKVDDKSKVCGAVDPKLTATVRGLVGEDKLIYTLYRSKGEKIGEYDIKVMLGDNPNYEVVVMGGKLNITDYSPEKAQNAEKSGYGETSIAKVTPSGATTAEITTNEMIIMKVEDTWTAIDNIEGVFKNGDTFSVTLLNSTNNREEWDKYVEKLDDDLREYAENDKLWVFLIDVIKPNGEKYTTLPQSIDWYIQLGNDWGKDDIHAVFISESTDATEQLKVETIPDYVLPDGTLTTMAKVTLNHFSTYAIYQGAEASVETDNTDNSPATGDTSNLQIWTLLAVVSCGAMCLTMAYERKMRKELKSHKDRK